MHSNLHKLETQNDARRTTLSSENPSPATAGPTEPSTITKKEISSLINPASGAFTDCDSLGTDSSLGDPRKEAVHLSLEEIEGRMKAGSWTSRIRPHGISGAQWRKLLQKYDLSRSSDTGNLRGKRSIPFSSGREDPVKRRRVDTPLVANERSISRKQVAIVCKGYPKQKHTEFHVSRFRDWMITAICEMDSSNSCRPSFEGGGKLEYGAFTLTVSNPRTLAWLKSVVINCKAWKGADLQVVDRSQLEKPIKMIGFIPGKKWPPDVTLKVLYKQNGINTEGWKISTSWPKGNGHLVVFRMFPDSREELRKKNDTLSFLFDRVTFQRAGVRSGEAEQSSMSSRNEDTAVADTFEPDPDIPVEPAISDKPDSAQLLENCMSNSPSETSSVIDLDNLTNEEIQQLFSDDEP